MVLYQWSECGVTREPPFCMRVHHEPQWLFSIEVTGGVERRATPDCKIHGELATASTNYGRRWGTGYIGGIPLRLKDVIEQIENDQGISLDAPDCLKLIRRAITAGNVAVVDDSPNGYQLKMSAVDDGGTAVEIRLPPPPARSLFSAESGLQQITASLHEDLEEGDEHFNSDLIEKLYVKLQRKMNAHIAKADAAVAKMRRGAAALREAVRVYDASFDASVAPNQSSLRRQGSGLAGISPRQSRAAALGSTVADRGDRGGGGDGGGGIGRGEVRGRGGGTKTQR